MIEKIYKAKGMEPRYPDPSTPMTWAEFSNYLEELKAALMQKYYGQ